jgi:hypothetical protein
VSRKLLARGKKKLESQFPLNSHYRNLSQSAESSELESFVDDPVGFARWLGVETITAEQIQIMTSVKTQPTTNVQASHGCGKTFISAVLVLWFVFAVGGLCITTAPTGRQVKELLWKEVRSLYDRNKKKLGGRRGVLKVEKNQEAYAYGFASYHYSTDTFQGIHAAALLVILDEANGISSEIDDGASSCITGSQNRILRIGNPTSPGTPFEKACKSKHIRIPAWCHPNVSWAYQLESDGMHRLKSEVAAALLTGDDNDPVLPQEEWPPEFPRDRIPGAVSISWIEKLRIDKGEKSNYWKTRVEGLFSRDAQSLVFNPELVEKAKTGAWQPFQYGNKYMLAIDPNFSSTGKDFYTAQIWDISNPLGVALVAEYRDRYKSKEYNLQKTYELGDRYSIVLAAIESNSGGNLYQQDIAKERPNWRVEGVNHSNASKLTNSDRLVLMTERNQLSLPPDCQLAYEMVHFIEEVEGKTRVRHAESGVDENGEEFHDDAVMAAVVMSAWVDEAVKVSHRSYSVSGRIKRTIIN